MNFDRALVLFLASVGAVTAFAPSVPTCRLMAVQQTRVAGTLFSDADAATETADEAVAEAPKEAEYDASIYVGNISFGMYILLRLVEWRAATITN